MWERTITTLVFSWATPPLPVARRGPVFPPPQYLQDGAALRCLARYIDQAMTAYPQKITFGEMRDSGVRDVLIYCRDHRCSHSTTLSADRSDYRAGAVMRQTRNSRT